MRQIVRVCLLVFAVFVLFRPASAQISITVEFAPPALPEYDQPPCPDEGFMWVPGYWAWDSDDYDYYWVPGTWVEAPEPGYLWTPPWWGWENGAYLFHDGYWATSIGFYGGIYYGFGYFGHGFEGGRWQGDHFFYNRAVVNITNVNIRNVYNETVVNRVTINRVSFNGGQGGIPDRPRPEELAVANQRHIPPVSAQTQHVQTARSNPQLRASANQGRPPVAATARVGDLHTAVAAKAAGAPYHAPPPRSGSGSTGARPAGNANPTHARDLQPHQAPAPQGTAPVNPKYQQQQQKLIEKQNQEHQKLQQQQEKEDQRAAKQQNQARQQQVEQRHAQQTQQMEQRHTQQQQRLENRQSPPPREPAQRPH